MFCNWNNYLFNWYAYSFKIVDEDIDMSKIGIGNDGVEEEQPTVAEVIDERPDSVRLMEEYSSNTKWKKIVNGNCYSFSGG